MAEKKTRRKFTDEEKAAAVALARSQSIDVAAEKYGKNNIYRWLNIKPDPLVKKTVKKSTKKADPQRGLATLQDEERAVIDASLRLLLLTTPESRTILRAFALLSPDAQKDVLAWLNR